MIVAKPKWRVKSDAGPGRVRYMLKWLKPSPDSKQKAIVFDLTFNEQDTDSRLSDQAFNDAIRGKHNVFFPYVRRELNQAAYIVKLNPLASILGLKNPEADLEAQGAFLLPKAIEPSEWRVGTVNFLEDEDGVGRRYELYTNISGWLVPSLPARVAADLGYQVPQQDNMVLRWRGGRDPYRTVSFSDFMKTSIARNLNVQLRNSKTRSSLLVLMHRP